MLIDSVDITVRGGKGGNGAVSFHREKFKPKGGPDGGNGGDGGALWISGVNNIRALKNYRETTRFSAENGGNGLKNKKHGKNGSDLTIYLPVGSRVYFETGRYIDILDDSPHCIAKGGKGGKGNWEFRGPTNQTPRYSESGTSGQKYRLHIKLMMIADVGIIGLPNAGKTSLLNALTRAQGKIGAYPFTTLEPNLGSMDGIIIADIPGLIEGSSSGRGLGFQFLQHISRTKLLIHALASDSQNPKEDYEKIRHELISYDPSLAEKPEIIVLTKKDITSTQFRGACHVSVSDEKSLNDLKGIITKTLKNTTTVVT